MQPNQPKSPHALSPQALTQQAPSCNLDEVRFKPAQTGSFPTNNIQPEILKPPRDDPDGPDLETSRAPSRRRITMPDTDEATTLPGCDAVFSQQSACGLFLTITLGLIAQPHVSLPYQIPRREGKVVKRWLATMTLLRLNLIDYLSEAAIISVYLVRPVCRICANGRGLTLRLIKGHKWHLTRLFVTGR